MSDNVVKTKNSKGLVVLVIILFFMVLGLGGFIVYDKFINIESTKSKTKTMKTEDITDSTLAKTLENSVKTNTRGLYYKNKITSTDYDNPDLIMFGIKKYLLENNITEYRNMVFGVEISDETTYKISKKTISEYMNKKYNTSGSYNLPITKSVSDAYYFEDVIDLVSMENDWGLTSLAKSGKTDYLHSELVKAEQAGDYVYVYDKMLVISEWSSLLGVSYTLENTNYDDYQCYSNAYGDYEQQSDTPLCPILLNESNMNNYHELLSSELFKQLNDKLNTFKHTFKKGSNGNYYWVSSELVNN